MGQQNVGRQQTEEGQRVKVWVLQGSYENELFSSVHLTEKGCVLACICDVLDFLGVVNEECARRVMSDLLTHLDKQPPELIEWDFEKMSSMTRKQLWKIFHDWTETVWDTMCDRSYYIDAGPYTIQA